MASVHWGSCNDRECCCRQACSGVHACQPALETAPHASVLWCWRTCLLHLRRQRSALGGRNCNRPHKGIIAIVLAGLVLKEVITGRHWVAGVLCAAGAYLVVRSAEGSAGYDELALAGVMSALMGAVFMACEALIMRYIAQREDTVTILAYVNVFAAVLLSGPVLWLIVKEGVSWNDLLIFAWMGPLAIIGQSMNISAYRRAGAATLAPCITAQWCCRLFSVLQSGEKFPLASLSLGPF